MKLVPWHPAQPARVPSTVPVGDAWAPRPRGSMSSETTHDRHVITGTLENVMQGFPGGVKVVKDSITV